MKRTTFFTTVLCSIVVSMSAFSQRPERPDFGSRHSGIVEKLKLLDTQKKDFEKLNSDFAKQRVEQQSKIKIAAIDLHSLMKADFPDKGAIEKKINEIGDLQAQNRMLGVDHWFSVNKILNPDQQKIWKGVLERPLRERFAARMRGMHRELMMQHNRPMPPDGDEQ